MQYNSRSREREIKIELWCICASTWSTVCTHKQCRHLNAAHSTDEVCLPSNEWWGEALRPNYHCYTKNTVPGCFSPLFHHTSCDAKYAPGDMFFWHDTCAGQQCTLPGAMDHECTPKTACTTCASWYRQLYCSNVTLPARLFEGSLKQTAASCYDLTCTVNAHNKGTC